MYINSIQFITRFRYYLSCIYVIFIKKCLYNIYKSWFILHANNSFESIFRNSVKFRLSFIIHDGYIAPV